MAEKTNRRCALEAGVPLCVSAVQIKPHSFSLHKIRKCFNFQNLWSNKSLVENRQPVILQEHTSHSYQLRVYTDSLNHLQKTVLTDF